MKLIYAAADVNEEIFIYPIHEVFKKDFLKRLFFFFSEERFSYFEV